MKSKPCPTCGGKIKLYYVNALGDDVYCEDCEREFRIISLTPVKLQPFDTFEEYDDYIFDEDDY